ncbi:winged helix-turn-helix transcriptional regulator [uncultured Gardnerella sp.]|uniref:winged helix-turn-helix domain-containing protein n=1 Tax=uncultured Gardnerella sp. TaxID=293424 RepID=UPI00263163B0|nr:winged helix-turn-helix transcriptional regulator [uncultured Gardnerella sp.]
MAKRQDGVLSGVLNDVSVDKIIEVIQNDPKITQVELVKILNIPYRSLQRKMDEMKDSGRIERIGGKRYGHWKINE